MAWGSDDVFEGHCPNGHVDSGEGEGCEGPDEVGSSTREAGKPVVVQVYDPSFHMGSVVHTCRARARRHAGRRLRLVAVTKLVRSSIRSVAGYESSTTSLNNTGAVRRMCCDDGIQDAPRHRVFTRLVWLLHRSPRRGRKPTRSETCTSTRGFKHGDLRSRR